MCCQPEQRKLVDDQVDSARAIGSASFGRGQYPKRRCKACGRVVLFHWWLANHRGGGCKEPA
jgi:hypothetical protein